MMPLPVNLDMDVLRSFVCGVDLGSFAKAGERLGRSPSAISLQLRKLEEQAGQPLVRRQGRGLALTEAGEILIAYARRILDLNDEARTALRGLVGLDGWARVGLPQDFAETWLPALLGRFAKAHPKVRVEARVDRGSALAEAVRTGALDIALTWGRFEGTECEVLTRRDMVWIGPQDLVLDHRDPVPIVAFDAPCAFRGAGIAALDRRGLAWRQVFASPSLSGLWAAVGAGLGVTPRTAEGKPPHLVVLDPRATGLPVLGAVDLVLHTAKADPGPVAAEIRTLIAEAVAAS